MHRSNQISSKSRLIQAVGIAFGLAVGTASAAPLYYDMSALSGLTPGAATWDASTTSAWQTSASPGTLAPGLWLSGRIATFHTNANNTVTVNGTVTADGLAVTTNTNNVSTTLGGTGVADFIALTGIINNEGGKEAFTVNTKINLLGDVTLTNSHADNTIVLNGVVSGNFGLTKNGTNDNGTAVLGAINTYTGVTTLNAGTLRIGVDNAINSASSVNFTGNSTLDLNGRTLTIAGLARTAGTTVVSSTAASTLTINNSASFSYDQAINGAVALVKNGTGTQTLNRSSTNNTYSGGTTINAGVLAVTGINNVGGTGANVTINTSGTLGVAAIEQAFLDRVVTTSDGTIALSALSNATLSFASGGGRNNLYLGSTGAFAYTASAANYTPGSNGYLLGGGGGTLTMGATNMLTSARPVTVRGGVVFSVPQNYTGATTITSGSLALSVAGATITSTVLDVQAGTFDAVAVTSLPMFTAIRGAGTIRPGTKTVGFTAAGTVTPGNSGPGTLTFDGSVNFSTLTDNAGGLKFELGSTSDQIVLSSGSLNMGVLNFGDFAFSQTTGFGFGTYKLFDTNSALNGSIGTASGTIPGAFSGAFGTLSIVGQDVVLTVIPEPATLAVLSLVGAVLCLRRGQEIL